MPICISYINYIQVAIFKKDIRLFCIKKQFDTKKNKSFRDYNAVMPLIDSSVYSSVVVNKFIFYHFLSSISFFILAVVI